MKRPHCHKISFSIFSFSQLFQKCNTTNHKTDLFINLFGQHGDPLSKRKQNEKNKNKSSVCGVSKMWTGNKKLRELVTLKILESFWTGLVT